MSDFGLVAEGPTDWVVLEHILLGACAWDDQPTIDPVELAAPLVDGKAAGGCTVVVEYLRGKWHEPLQFHRYVVIQIDTDVVAEVWNQLGLPNPPLPTAGNIVDTVIGALSALIDEQYRDRFFFAVGVDAIECWLLGLVIDRSQDAKRRKTTGCYPLLREKLSSRGKDKDHSKYLTLSKPFRKRQAIDDCSPLNPGFASFVRQLERAEPPPP